MGSVPNERKEILTRDPIRWFKCKLKPPKNKEKIGKKKDRWKEERIRNMKIMKEMI